MSQADLDELRQQVRDLTARISRLEQSLVPSESLPPAPDAAPFALPQDPDILSQVPDSASVLPVIGASLLGLAGAYLLRAIAESGALPSRLVFAMGTLYAVMWLIWAARASLDRRFAATLYSLTSVLILSPLLWESTHRFHMITAWEASMILVAFTLIGLAVSWRRDLLMVATITTLAGLATAGALLIATHNVLPFTFAFLAIAAAVEVCACLNHWLGERWLAAAAADLAVLLATWLVTNPRGLPEVYAPIPAGQLFAAQIALLAIYLSSVIVRTLLRGLAFTNFETVQCAVAFLVGVGGALNLSAGNAHITPVLGGFCLICGAACYAISFIVLERHGSHGRNFYTYSTFAILLVVVGCRILWRGGAAEVLWSLLAIACIGAGGRWSKLTLEVHGGIYLVLALAFSGALRQAGGFLLDANLWSDSSHVALWIGVAVTGACYLLAARSAPFLSLGWNFRALRIALAGILVWEVLGLTAGGLTGICRGLFGVEGTDPFCITLRTGAVTCAAVLLALAGARPKLRDLGQLVYPLMLLGAYRLIAHDMHHDRKAALVLSLLLYGAALMAIPRLRRAPVNPSPAN
jgi:hypothetical protein